MKESSQKVGLPKLEASESYSIKQQLSGMDKDTIINKFTKYRTRVLVGFVIYSLFFMLVLTGALLIGDHYDNKLIESSKAAKMKMSEAICNLEKKGDYFNYEHYVDGDIRIECLNGTTYLR